MFRVDLPLIVEKERTRKPKPGEEPKPPIRIVVCPSLNEYSRMKGYEHAKSIEQVDALLSVARAAYPATWHWGGRQKTWIEQVKDRKTGEVRDVVRRSRWGGTRRGVRVVRHSSRRIDETATDVLGGRCRSTGSSRWVCSAGTRRCGVSGAASGWRRSRAKVTLIEVYDIEGEDGVVKVTEK